MTEPTDYAALPTWPERDRRSGPDRRADAQRVIDAAKNAYVVLEGSFSQPTPTVQGVIDAAKNARAVLEGSVE